MSTRRGAEGRRPSDGGATVGHAGPLGSGREPDGRRGSRPVPIIPRYGGSSRAGVPARDQAQALARRVADTGAGPRSPTWSGAQRSAHSRVSVPASWRRWSPSCATQAASTSSPVSRNPDGLSPAAPAAPGWPPRGRRDFRRAVRAERGEGLGGIRIEVAAVACPAFRVDGREARCRPRARRGPARRSPQPPRRGDGTRSQTGAHSPGAGRARQLPGRESAATSASRTGRETRELACVPRRGASRQSVMRCSSSSGGAPGDEPHLPRRREPHGGDRQRRCTPMAIQNAGA
mgnify:CR=1 FL=1